jgi:fructose-bisphosphate aldolase class II
MAGEEDGSGAEGKLDHSQLLTDPDEAADFVKKTGVDALAIAIGTSHGAYKFTRPPTGDILAIERIKQIHKRIPTVHLVMHGSSSVPQEWLKIINSYGGDMGQTYGVPVEEIVQGIKHGVRKVNIDTDLRMSSTGAVRKFLAENKKEFDPRKWLAASTKGMKEICKQRYQAFGCAGQASKIKVLSLEAMTTRYAKGELDPKATNDPRCSNKKGAGNRPFLFWIGKILTVRVSPSVCSGHPRHERTIPTRHFPFTLKARMNGNRAFFVLPFWSSRPMVEI